MVVTSRKSVTSLHSMDLISVPADALNLTILKAIKVSTCKNISGVHAISGKYHGIILLGIS